MAQATGSSSAVRRRYRSGLRAQQAEQTRRAVLQAAYNLFVVDGWAATGMRDVASAAGVALETVYSHFSSKRGLLRAVIDESVVGDDVPQRLAERPEFLAMGQGRRAARVRAGARLLTGIQQRTAPIARLMRQAAASDREIADMLREARERQRLDTAGAFELIVGRPPSADERDGLWAVFSPDVYLLLVDESGWTAERYESWIEETIGRVLPHS